jgi:hypothetical protein
LLEQVVVVAETKMRVVVALVEFRGDGHYPIQLASLVLAELLVKLVAILVMDISLQVAVVVVDKAVLVTLLA